MTAFPRKVLTSAILRLSRALSLLTKDIKTVWTDQMKQYLSPLAKMNHESACRAYGRSHRGLAVKREGMKRARWKAKIACLLKYGGDPPKCACCGETNIGFLTIDHVNNDGRAHKKSLKNKNIYLALRSKGFPTDPPVIVLCFNCNCGRDRNGGVCPHKEPHTFKTYKSASQKHVSHSPLFEGVE